MSSHPTHDPDPALQPFYDLNPTHRSTQEWANPHRGWHWIEAEVTLGDRVQRALAGGENLPLNYHGEDPGDIRWLRADHIATLAQRALHPHRTESACDTTATLDRTHQRAHRRPPER